MIQIQRIVCAVDFSEPSRRALDHAVALARWYSARLTLLHVHPVPLSTLAAAPLLAPLPTAATALSPAERESLQQQLRSCVPRSASDVAVDCRIAEGDAVPEILAEAGTADLLVTGTHGRSGVERVVLGSTAERLLRQTRGPMLIVPGAAPDATGPVPRLFHHIVAAIDFSPASVTAAAWAISLAEEADAHLTLVHALELPARVEAWMAETQDGHARMERWRHDASARLRELVPADARTYCHIDDRVEADSASRVILDVAEERDAGLVVMGAHGAGPFEWMLVGSTTQRVVRRARCPVLIIR